MTIKLYNTLTRQKEEFVPIKPGHVSMYACGPTVYARAHIGNLRTYLFEDVLSRTLRHAGYDVNHVMNITDVGHLQSDADEGEDKMNVAAIAAQRSPWDIAREFEDLFFADSSVLNIRRPDIVTRATDYIPQMQKFIAELEAKGFCYRSNQNLYFDTSKFSSYPDFGKLDLKGQVEGARDTVEKDHGKRNPQDFVLWFTSSKFPNQIMKWDSPWGVGFPGWHIECSVMASEHLGEHIDIHCGGIDHISVHHTNEIAQSECHHGHKWVNYWMHGNFLTVDSGRIGKSKGNALTVQTLMDEGYDLLHYRYLCLQAHYRGELLFSYDSLDGARNAYESIRNRVIDWGNHRNDPVPLSEKAKNYQSDFWDAVEDDLNTPIALSHLWGMMKDMSLHVAEKFALLRDFDQALGLNIEKMADIEIDPKIKELIDQRQQARMDKNFALSDQIRAELLERGIVLKDTPDGPVWMKKGN